MHEVRNGEKPQPTEMLAILIDNAIGELFLKKRKGIIRKKWTVIYVEMGSLYPLIERKFKGKEYTEAYDYFQNIAHRFHFTVIDTQGEKSMFAQVADEFLKKIKQ
jgi:outer membrane protein assembly factor BamD (BamD/ComL family)